MFGFRECATENDFLKRILWHPLKNCRVSSFRIEKSILSSMKLILPNSDFLPDLIFLLRKFQFVIKNSLFIYRNFSILTFSASLLSSSSKSFYSSFTELVPRKYFLFPVESEQMCFKKIYHNNKLKDICYNCTHTERWNCLSIKFKDNMSTPP